MNATPKILTLGSSPSAVEEVGHAGPARQPLAGPAGLSAPPRRRSKIARLPKAVRTRLNELLEDGLTYPQVLQTLGPEAQDITPDNLSDWFRSGHQDWLKERAWREEMGARLEGFSDLLTDIDPAQVSMAGLELSILQICEQLRDFTPGIYKEQFDADADKYLRMLNTLARLSKSLLALQQHREAAAAKANAASPSAAQPSPGGEPS